MKIGLVYMVSLLLVLGRADLIEPQKPNEIAILNVKAVAQSYRLGETPVIQLTIRNVSDKTICFMESPVGAYKVELYDMQDSTGADLLKPYRNNNSADSQSMTVCSELQPGQSEVVSEKLEFSAAQLIKHSGTYQVQVSRREATTHTTIVGNPVMFTITSK